MGITPPGLATAADLVGEHDERWEVVDGELVEKAGPDFEHGQAQGTLREALGPYRRRPPAEGGWWLGTEVRVQFELHQVFLPEISGWRRERHPLRPAGRPVLAIPDWVCEVLSDSTKRRDLRQKVPVYHRQKVEHVWLVDPADRLLTVYRWTEPGYVLVATAGVGDAVRTKPFEGVEIDVADLFDAGQAAGGSPGPSATDR